MRRARSDHPARTSRSVATARMPSTGGERRTAPADIHCHQRQQQQQEQADEDEEDE